MHYFFLLIRAAMHAVYLTFSMLPNNTMVNIVLRLFSFAAGSIIIALIESFTARK